MIFLTRATGVVLEGVDKFSNLNCSIHYRDGDIAKNLALELVSNDSANFFEWSAKRHLKTPTLHAKNIT